MPFANWLKSLPEHSPRHVRIDLDAFRFDLFPFLENDQTTYQIERLSLHLSAQPAIIRLAVIRYSLYVRQLHAIQEQERTIGRLCATDCHRPPVGCCNGEHHVIISFSDVMFARPTQNALHLAHVLTGMQVLEHAHALQQGLVLRSAYCSRLTTTGCSLRMFKSPRCIHYLCPQVMAAITDAYGPQASAFLEAMHTTSNQVILGMDDFTSPSVIGVAEALFLH